MERGSLNIAALSRRTGIPADTLRKWEQRYGILRPARTPGGQRRYSETDVHRVEWLQARLTEGYRIGEAAALLGGESRVATRTPAELREVLIEAVSRCDTRAVERLLDQTFTLNPLADTLRLVIRPVLEHVGRAWPDGELAIAKEHLLTASVRARLERLLADTRGTVRGVAVLACAEGEHHELGLLSLAVQLRADGWQVAFLGASTPLPEALSLAEQLAARLVAVSVTCREPLENVQRSLQEIDVPAGVELVLGGPGARAEVARRHGLRPISEDPEQAVAELRQLSA